MGFANKTGYNRSNNISIGTNEPASKDRIWIDNSTSPTTMRYWDETDGMWVDMVEKNANVVVPTLIYQNYADLPSVGEIDKYYVVKQDESNTNGGASTYVWNDTLGKYVNVDNDLDSNDTLDAGTF